MDFNTLDKQMRRLEQSLDRTMLEGIYVVARLDGHGFTRLTKKDASRLFRSESLRPFPSKLALRNRWHPIQHARLHGAKGGEVRSSSEFSLSSPLAHHTPVPSGANLPQHRTPVQSPQPHLSHHLPQQTSTGLPE